MHKRPNMVYSHKEEPNTPNISAWPEGYTEDKVTRRSIRTDPVDSKINYDWSLWMEKFEFYIFLVVGGVLWYSLVMKILAWHRFPFHSYTVEVCFIIAVPILLLAFVLAIMDKSFRKKND